MKSSLLRLSLVLLLVAVILLVWDGCNKRVELSAFKNQISKLDIQNQFFTQKINDKNQTIVEQEQVILSQKDAIALNLLEIDRLIKIKSQVRIKSIIDIDTIFIPYTDIDTIYYKDSCDFIEKKFFVANDYYVFGGVTKKNGILLDSVSFNNNMKITIVNKRMGLFKKSKPIVEVVYENPYVKTKQMNNVIIEDKKKWYQRNGTWFGVGIGLGLFGGLLIAL